MEKIEQLLAERAALDQKIEEARRRQKSEAVARIKALMSEHGLTLADLGLRGATAPGKPARKLPPKFRNPTTGETWSGRGLQPNWLKSALAAGAQLADFKV